MISADSPWKEVCERKLGLVFALLYPDAHAALDWSKDDEALDQELRRLSPASAAPGRVADRLLKASAAGTGDPRYFHLEVQGKKVAASAAASTSATSAPRSASAPTS
jgi:hypothetical protein